MRRHTPSSGSTLVRRWIQTPSTANGPECGSTGGEGRPRSFPSGPPSRHALARVRRMSQQRFDDLRERLSEIFDLGKAAAVLAWDQQTKMPPRGAPARAEQLATIGRIAHEKFTSDDVGKLLDDLAAFEQ